MPAFIQYMQVRWDEVGDQDAFPYCLPAVKTLDTLTFDPSCTFFIGENGSGKSTLMEAIAVEMGFSAEGGSKNHRFSSFDSHSDLHKHIFIKRHNWDKPGDTFFLRAETLYNFATLSGSFKFGDLHSRSHGEAFLDIVANLRPHGLYLMDEPESALSPQRQLAFLMRMDELIKQGSQFIIATHSPIILAYPGAKIYEFTEGGVKETEYEETDHYRLTKDFLNRRGSFLRHLGSEV